MGFRYNSLVRLLDGQELAEGLHQAHGILPRTAAEAEIISTAPPQGEPVKRLAIEVFALAHLRAGEFAKRDGAAAKRDNGCKPNNFSRLLRPIEGRHGADAAQADTPYSQSIVRAFNNRQWTLHAKTTRNQQDLCLNTTPHNVRILKSLLQRIARF